MLSDEGLALFRLITAESGRFPEVGKLFYAEAAGPVEASLAAYLRRHMDRGALLQDDPARLARTSSPFATDFKSAACGVLRQLDPGQIEDEARRVADVFLRAFGAPARL